MNTLCVLKFGLHAFLFDSWNDSHEVVVHSSDSDSIHDCKTLRRPPTVLMVRALRSGSKSWAALRFLEGDKRHRDESKVREGDSVERLRVDWAGDDDGSSLMLGLTAILPPIGLIAERGRAGCLRMDLLGGTSTELVGLSQDLSRETIGVLSPVSSSTSHSSLSASAVFFMVLDRTRVQNMADTSSSWPRDSSTNLHRVRPEERFRSGPKTPSGIIGAKWHHFKSGMYVKTNLYEE